MVRIYYNELKKVLERLEKDGVGDVVKFKIDRTKLIIGSQDRQGREIEGCLHDVDYNYKPTIRVEEEV